MNRVMVRSKMYIYTNFEFIYGNYIVGRKGFVFSDFIREKERKVLCFLILLESLIQNTTNIHVAFVFVSIGF